MKLVLSANIIRLLILGLFLSPIFALAQDQPDRENTSDDSSAKAVISEPQVVEDWQICNETSFILRLALAKRSADVFNVKGWQRLRSSECISETLNVDVPRFLFAESDPVHNGGIREWAGTVPLCINPAEDFDINTNVSCSLQGLVTRRFLRIDPEEPVTKLIEPDDFKTKAETAGLQRLMQDAGFAIKRVDGINGRRTRNTFKNFLKDQQVDTELPILDQMDALAQFASSNAELTGLTVCNGTEAKSWIAIGYREDGSWQSRGWWGLSANECIRPWSKNLQGAEMHLYAQQGEFKEGEETGIRVLKNPIETANNFCVGEAKFSALGREYCLDQGYVAADFRPLATEDKGLKINLTEDDFIMPQSGGLRQ